MDAIFPKQYNRGVIELSGVSDFIRFCGSGDIDKIKGCLAENVNIYEQDKTDRYYLPLFVALGEKNQEVIDLLLDVYERDLEALEGTNFTRALLAFPEDQTEEFWKTVETEASDNVIPVLIKNNNSETPKCVYLRKQLKDRNDLSHKFANDLEDKNEVCDLNWRSIYDYEDDTFLHIAIYNRLKPTVKRLLNNRTVERNFATRQKYIPLHYAFYVGNFEAINELTSTLEDGKSLEEPSFLYQVIQSGKLSVINFFISKLMENGKTLKEILRTSFVFDDFPYSREEKEKDFLFHVLVKAGNFISFINESKFSFKDEDFFIQNSKGETILHLLVSSFSEKISLKIKRIRQIAERFPKLLLIENNECQLPLHYAALSDVLGQRLYHCLHELTVEESGNQDIFFSNNEVALKTLEKAIEVHRGLSEEYLKNFKKLVESNGPRLLQTTISVEYNLKSLRGILSLKINPNEFYNGTNTFLAITSLNTAAILRRRPYEEVNNRFKMLVDYHKIEDFNARDQSGTTLFMNIVAFSRDNDYIRYCIESGADCKAKNDENFSCLHFAATNHKNEEIIGILLNHGADPLAIGNSLNQMAIHFAIECDNLVAVDTLIASLRDEDLERTSGNKGETLIQQCFSQHNDSIIKLIWDLYASRDIKINVNQTNSKGQNLPMIALNVCYCEHLDFILSQFIDEVNFEIKDSDGNTFAHLFSACQQAINRTSLIDKFPVLAKVLNDQLNEKNSEEEEITAMDHMAELCSRLESTDEAFPKFLIQYISLDNLKINFHKFVQSFILVQMLIEHFPNILDDADGYEILMESLSEQNVFIFLLEKLNLHKVKSSTTSRNILHLVCANNDSRIIDSVLKRMNDDAFKSLVEELDEDNKKPLELLNEANKVLFGNCFLLK